MHLIAVVAELKGGRKVVVLNNKRVYVSTDQGLLEPGDFSWLWLMPPMGSRVRGCAFDCGSVNKAPRG
jgi:hypothetical protein